MSADQIVEELKSSASESVRKVLLKHGIPEPVLGVKIEHLKKIQKRIKSDYQLALDLYDTGIYDAMYLAGLIADDRRMTKRDLQKWARSATCSALCSYTVAWVAAGSQHGWELGLKWIDAKQERIAVAGWSTIGSMVGIIDDTELDLVTLKALIKRVQREIHNAPNDVRYAMNGFVIATGSYVESLTEFALQTARRTGQVTVDMGDTACKVPFAPDAIAKVQAKGRIGKKRSTAKC